MPKILLVCQVSADIGLGHLSRLTALAKSLESNGIVTPEILIFGDFFLKDGISNFSTHLYSFTDDFVTSVEKVVIDGDFNAVVLDLHTSENIKGFKTLLLGLKKNNIHLIAIDSLLEYCDVMDLVWIPSFNFDISNHINCKCIIKYGWDSYLIQKRFPTREWVPGPKVLVLTGGSDPTKLSRSLPEYIDNSLGKNVEINWVHGPFAELPNLSNHKNLNWIIHSSPSGIDELIVNSNYVLTVYGVALFEVLQYGVPAIVFSPYGKKDDSELRALSGLNIASVADNSFDAVDKLKSLMKDHDLARRYSFNSSNKLTNNGAKNLAKHIHQLIEV